MLVKLSNHIERHLLNPVVVKVLFEIFFAFGVVDETLGLDSLGSAKTDFFGRNKSIEHDY
jgi:hypothetical protein